LLDVYRASNVPQAFTIHAYPVEQQCTISTCIKSLLAKVLQDAQSEFEKSLARQTLQDLVAGIYTVS
jgi:DNA-binding IscR family transcriptional regulator